MQARNSVNTSSPFVTIAQPGRYKVVSHIPESMIFQVETGKAVHVVPEAAPNESFVGALRVDDYPSASSKEGNLYDAEVSLPKLSPRYRAGMKVKIRIGQADPETAEGR